MVNLTISPPSVMTSVENHTLKYLAFFHLKPFHPLSTWIMGTTAVAMGNCAMAPSAKPATTAAAWRLMEIRFLQMNWGRTLLGDNGGQIYTLCILWKYQTRYVYPKVCVSHRISCIWKMYKSFTHLQIDWTIETKEKLFCPALASILHQ